MARGPRVEDPCYMALIIVLTFGIAAAAAATAAAELAGLQKYEVGVIMGWVVSVRGTLGSAKFSTGGSAGGDRSIEGIVAKGLSVPDMSFGGGELVSL